MGGIQSLTISTLYDDKKSFLCHFYDIFDTFKPSNWREISNQANGRLVTYTGHGNRFPEKLGRDLGELLNFRVAPPPAKGYRKKNTTRNNVKIDPPCPAGKRGNTSCLEAYMSYVLQLELLGFSFFGVKRHRSMSVKDEKPAFEAKKKSDNLRMRFLL